MVVYGLVINKEQEPMRTLLEINDGTGSFKVIFYQKAEHEDPKALKNYEYKPQTWVRVMGTVRVFKETTAIVGNTIFQVI